jgi:two-component system cell cycle sensor histidine kinase PleC
MTSSLTSHRAAVDPRILNVQVERAANTLAGSLVASPVWALVAAVACSEFFPHLGAVPFAYGIGFVGLMCCAVLGVRGVLALFHRERRDGMNTEADAKWLRRLLVTNVILSTVWGLAPWMLWSEDDPLNHVFIELICLAAVARFLVNRANHVSFFLASFLPMAAMLFVRCIGAGTTVDLILAAVVVLYAIQVVLDSSQVSQRWDQEAQTRFSHEDLSRELEEARDEALLKRAEAEAANASKTAFLANISHELRTPLNAILGFSELIARECLGPVGSPRYKEYAGDIHNSGTHLLSLINDLLDVAKIEAGRMEVEPQMVETERTLEAALKFVVARARDRRQTLTITVDQSAAVLYADERALKQIVINLVSNAVKFTQDGGHIEVSAARNAQSDFELIVADNGPGISREKIDRVFRPFSQVDNRYDRQAGGTGLGLALVRGLSELHGGRAWIESEPGKGTRVIVVLPAKVEKIGTRKSEVGNRNPGNQKGAA